MRIRTLMILIVLGLGMLHAGRSQTQKESNMDTARVRSIRLSRSTQNTSGFKSDRTRRPTLRCFPAEIWNSCWPFGPGGAAKPISDGRKAEPGGWTRIIITVNNLPAEVAKLKKAQLHVRNEIVSGLGGSEILLDDPSGNPIELFQAAR